MDRVDHEHAQIQPGQVRAQQPDQGRLGLGDELSGHRRLRRAPRGLHHLIPDRFQPDRVAAGRQPGEHFLPRQPPEELGAAEQLIEATGSSPDPSTARTRGRLTGTRRPARVTDPGPDPCRPAAGPGRSGPAAAATSASISAVITCNPAPTANASSPSGRFSVISAITTLTRSAQPPGGPPARRSSPSGRSCPQRAPVFSGVLVDAQHLPREPGQPLQTGCVPPKSLRSHQFACRAAESGLAGPPGRYRTPIGVRRHGRHCSDDGPVAHRPVVGCRLMVVTSSVATVCTSRCRAGMRSRGGEASPEGGSG